MQTLAGAASDLRGGGERARQEHSVDERERRVAGVDDEHEQLRVRGDDLRQNGLDAALHCCRRVVRGGGGGGARGIRGRRR